MMIDEMSTTPNFSFLLGVQRHKSQRDRAALDIDEALSDVSLNGIVAGF